MPTPNQSETPRTDAVILHCDVYRRNGNESHIAWEFARELERELDEAKKRILQMEDGLTVAHLSGFHERNDEVRKLIKEREALKAEVGRLSKEAIMNTAFIETLIDPWKEEAKQWQACAEWLYEYVTHGASCWTKDYMNLKAKDCTCRLKDALAEFEKLKEGK